MLVVSFPPQNFEVKADDLEPISELGRGAYGVVEKMRHMPSGQIMAVKVEWSSRGAVCLGHCVWTPSALSFGPISIAICSDRSCTEIYFFPCKIFLPHRVKSAEIWALLLRRGKCFQSYMHDTSLLCIQTYCSSLSTVFLVL